MIRFVKKTADRALLFTGNMMLISAFALSFTLVEIYSIRNARKSK